VEHERVDDFVGECIFLLEECFDEDVAGPGGVRVRAHLLGGNFAKTVERRGGMEDGDGYFRDDGGDDYGFALRAGCVCEQGEY
jgi:hypothetical protein